MKLLKHCLGILLLAVFLFPQVEKSLHAFEHEDEIHCTETETHFHEAGDHCSICDYELTQLFSFSPSFLLNSNTICISHQVAEVVSQCKKQQQRTVALRGPPYIS